MRGQLRIIQGGHLKIRGDWEKFKYEGHTKFLGGIEKIKGARLSGGLLQRGVLNITGIYKIQRVEVKEKFTMGNAGNVM